LNIKKKLQEARKKADEAELEMFNAIESLHNVEKKLGADITIKDRIWRKSDDIEELKESQKLKEVKDLYKKRKK